jgi:hypothetical protein
MEFRLDESIEILERTPGVLAQMLSGLSHVWTHNNESGDTWSAYDVMGHLIEGEKTDWIPRLKIIIEGDGTGRFTPFDRFAQLEKSKVESIESLITEFSELRKNNILLLRRYNLSNDHLQKTGIHPAFGRVTARQLIATWAVHDLTHLRQIVRVMAFQYTEEVGPWKAYLGILNDKRT